MNNQQQNNGWIKIHRKLEQWPLYFTEPFTKAQAWIDMLILANHKDGVVNVRGNIITIKRGQLGWSEESLSVRWKWSRNKVRRFLKWLETKQQTIQQKSPILSTITILKYNEYQINETTDDTTERQQTIQQTDTNKNVKKEKNVKNKYMDFVFLTNDEHTKLGEQLGLKERDEAIERLNLYIGSKGKKYKSHYFTILNWNKKNEKQNASPKAPRIGSPEYYKPPTPEQLLQFKHL